MTCQNALCIETFANELRMSLLELLQKSPMNVSSLTKASGAERSRVSHALIELKKCNVIVAERDGRNVFYRLNDNTPLDSKGSLLALIDNHRTHNCHTCHKGVKLSR